MRARVCNGNEPSGGTLNGDVPALRYVRAGSLNHDNGNGRTGRDSVDDAKRPVGRTAIDDDDLVGSQRLNEERGQPLLDAASSRVNGTAKRVYWARDAKAIVFGAVGDGQSRLAVLSPDQLSIERGLSAAGEPCDVVTAKSVPVPVGKSGKTSVDLWRLGALMRTAQLAGAAERALHIAVDYARERKQFGRPIGKFQAVQQLLAELAGQSAATGAAAEMAAAAEELGRDKMALAAAKTRASEAAGRISAMAHQTLGAMGFTYEHHLHQFTRRLWVWRDDYGSDAWWARRLGRAITQAGAPTLWKSLTDGASLGQV